MAKQNLHFNILTFDFPQSPLTFYFNKEEEGFCHRLHRTQFPLDVNDLFPGTGVNGTEFIYTTYTFQNPDFSPIEIDLSTDNAILVKKYYNRQIFHFFKKVKGMIARHGFIDETVVWIPSEEKDKLFDVYERFSIKVQLRTVSKYSELLISYNGKARVNKKPVLKQVKKNEKNKKAGSPSAPFQISNLELNTEMQLEAGRFSIQPEGSIFVPVGSTDHTIFGYWQLGLHYSF